MEDKKRAEHMIRRHEKLNRVFEEQREREKVDEYVGSGGEAGLDRELRADRERIQVD